MAEEESVALLRPVVPLPIALYELNGLLFELYEGGRPYRHHHIVWVRLKPIGEEVPLGAIGQASSGIHK
jgi:hypothetical protein